MGKRKPNYRDRNLEEMKRVRISSQNYEEITGKVVANHKDSSYNFQIQQKDRIESRVDLIVKDTQNNSQRSLTIWGTGLGVEKTIAVVEELKRNYTKAGTKYSQETSIKTDDNNEPHLQVILTLHGLDGNP